MSRPNRSYPFPKWRTSSSFGRRTSPQPVFRSSLKHAGHSCSAQDSRQERSRLNSARFPYSSADVLNKSRLPTSRSPMTSRPDERSESSLRNSNKFLESYQRHSRDIDTKLASQQNRLKPVSHNDRRCDPYFSNLKRSPAREALPYFPPPKKMKFAEDKHSYHQSKSLRQSNSGILWHSPPCHQRSQSRERKSDSIRLDSLIDHHNKSHSARDLVSNDRKAHGSLRDSYQKHDRQASSHLNVRQQPITWRQYSLDKNSNSSRKSSSWSSVRHSSPNIRKKASGTKLNYRERQSPSIFLSRNVARNSRDDERSPKMFNKHSKERETLDAQDSRCQQDRERQNEISTAPNDQCLQNDFSREHKSDCRAHTRKHSHDNKSLRDSIGHQEPEYTASGSRSPRVESYRQNDDSWPRSVTQDNMRSRSSSCSSGRTLFTSKVSTSQSRERERSTDSSHSSTDIQVKAQVPAFNPDYVVIVRRSGEGARPLYTREEFCGTVILPAKVDEQKSVQKAVTSPDKNSASSGTFPADLNQKSDNTTVEVPPNVKDPSPKISPAKKKKVPTATLR